MKKLIQILTVAMTMSLSVVAQADHDPIIIDLDHDRGDSGYDDYRGGSGYGDYNSRVDLLAKIHGSQFYRGQYGVVSQVVSVRDLGYRSFALLGGRRMLGDINGTAFVECRRSSGTRVRLSRTVIGGLEGAQFSNPCGSGGADRIDFYIDARRFDRNVNYKVVGIR